jgi:hypothetical protein
MGNALGGMNMTKIESVRDLPEWFDIEKYNGCESFRAADWYQALFFRFSLFQYMECIDHPEIGESIKRDLFSVRANPLNLLSLVNAPFSNLKFMPPVSTLTFGRLLEQCRIERVVDRVSSARRELFASDLMRHNIPTSIDEMPLLLSRFEAVTVDLGATDSVILESFRLWLKDARSSRPEIKTSRNKPAYGNWARYGLLPYLDLWLWEKETGDNIPDKVISSALSRNGYDAGEGNVRKTVGKWARDLMQDLSALHALAAIETAEQSETETFERQKFPEAF